MQNKNREESAEARPRYVWDPKKLTWVETTEAVTEKVPEEKARPDYEEIREERAPTEAIREERVPIEAVVDTGSLFYVGAWIRLAAFIVDFVIVTILIVIIDQLGTVPNWSGVVLGFFYFVGFWSWRGQTPGKMLIGAKIVKTDGRPATPVNAGVRYIFYLIPSFAPIIFFAGAVDQIRDNLTLIAILLGVIGLVVIGFSRNKRGIHDLIAGTCVVRTRSGLFQRGRRGESDEVEPYETSEPEVDKTETDNQA